MTEMLAEKVDVGRVLGPLRHLADAVRARVQQVTDHIATARLAPALDAANQQTYLYTLQELARAVHASAPRRLLDRAALDGIHQRAAISAQSIVETRAVRMAALLDQHGSRQAAEPAYRQWAQTHGDLVASFEARMTANEAAKAFIAHNQLSGTAHVEPTTTAGLDDSCDAAVAAGEIPISAIDLDMPAHPRCPHAWVYQFDMPTPGQIVWTGDDDGQ